MFCRPSVHQLGHLSSRSKRYSWTSWHGGANFDCHGYSGAPGVSSQGPWGRHVVTATTSQPWPWAVVRGERGVTAETRETSGEWGGVRKGKKDAIRSEGPDRLLSDTPNRTQTHTHAHTLIRSTSVSKTKQEREEFRLEQHMTKQLHQRDGGGTCCVAHFQHFHFCPSSAERYLLVTAASVKGCSQTRPVMLLTFWGNSSHPPRSPRLPPHQCC